MIVYLLFLRSLTQTMPSHHHISITNVYLASASPWMKVISLLARNLCWKWREPNRLIMRTWKLFHLLWYVLILGIHPSHCQLALFYQWKVSGEWLFHLPSFLSVFSPFISFFIPTCLSFIVLHLFLFFDLYLCLCHFLYSQSFAFLCAYSLISPSAPLYVSPSHPPSCFSSFLFPHLPIFFCLLDSVFAWLCDFTFPSLLLPIPPFPTIKLSSSPPLFHFLPSVPSSLFLWAHSAVYPPIYHLTLIQMYSQPCIMHVIFFRCQWGSCQPDIV